MDIVDGSILYSGTFGMHLVSFPSADHDLLSMIFRHAWLPYVTMVYANSLDNDFIAFGMWLTRYWIGNIYILELVPCQRTTVPQRDKRSIQQGVGEICIPQKIVNISNWKYWWNLQYAYSPIKGPWLLIYQLPHKFPLLAVKSMNANYMCSTGTAYLYEYDIIRNIP